MPKSKIKKLLKAVANRELSAVGIFIEEDNIKYYKIHIGDLENNEDVKKILDDMEEAIKMEGVLEELFISRGVEKWK